MFLRGKDATVISKIFVGLLLVFLDINFTFNTTTIGLLPDFIGYFILIGGLAEMAAVNSHFGKARPFAIAMAIYTLILYILDLIGLSAALGYAATILGLLSTLISLYLSYHIVRGVMEIEDAQARSLNGTPLFTTWKVMAVADILAYLLLFIPGLNVICIIVRFVFGMVFLVHLNRTRKAYECPPANF